jgi:glutamine amidotransferase
MIAILQACGANLASVQFAIARLGKEAVLTVDPAVLQSASHVILPGVGTARHAMQTLVSKDLIKVIYELKSPVLGFCLGVQILFEHSEEGEVPCLGLIPGKVTAMPEKEGYTLPHMGWNQLHIRAPAHPLFADIPDKSYVYYVHSYAAAISEHTLASSRHTCDFSGIVQHRNFYGMQFHPERSGKIGARLLHNFLQL